MALFGGGGCEETYGVFPCSTSLIGNIFLMLGYGYVLLQGANLLSDGSELLLEVLNPGIIGGLVLPILGALPDALIIVVSGLGASASEAQQQVAVGVGTLAGSTIMLLTIAWGGALLAGRCDLDENGKALSRTITKTWSLVETGVTTDTFTPQQAKIMCISVLLYAVIQVPAFISTKEDGPAALTGGILCILTLAAYCAFQCLYPELQRRQMERARKARYRMAAVRAVEGAASSFGSLLDSQGNVNHQTIEHLFHLFDTDDNGSIDETELRALLMGLSVGKHHSGGIDEDLHYWMNRFDKDSSGTIQFTEFEQELSKWVKEKHAEFQKAKQDQKGKGSKKRGLQQISVQQPQAEQNGQEQPLLQCGPRRLPVSACADLMRAGEARQARWRDQCQQMRAGREHGEHQEDGEEQEDAEQQNGEQNGHQAGDDAASSSGSEDGEEDSDSSDDEDEHKGNLSSAQIMQRASLMLLAGGLLCAIISDPMVDAVSHFSTASGIPAFFCAFAINPFASNAMELISSIKFAKKRRKKNISLTDSQIYGGVTMNNTLCLGLFLLVVWSKGLTWTYTSEVAATVGATLMVGILGISRTTFRTFWAVPVLLLYPGTILFVYLGDYVFKWDEAPTP